MDNEKWLLSDDREEVPEKWPKMSPKCSEQRIQLVEFFENTFPSLGAVVGAENTNEQWWLRTNRQKNKQTSESEKDTARGVDEELKEEMQAKQTTSNK